MHDSIGKIVQGELLNVAIMHDSIGKIVQGELLNAVRANNLALVNTLLKNKASSKSSVKWCCGACYDNF
jgi:hypothetical protein